MSVITKPIRTIIHQDIFAKINHFIRKSMIKYFLWTILIVFVIQTIRRVTLFTIGTFLLSLSIFSVFVGLGILLMFLAGLFYKLAMTKDLLEINMKESGLTIVSRYKGQREEQAELILWKGIQAVKSDAEHFYIYFDEKKTTGFQLVRNHLSADELAIINQWLSKETAFQLV